MSQTYRTKEGETLDYICWKYYGTPNGLIVEQVLGANVHLADYGPLYPAGVLITLPDIVPAPTNKSVHLWD